MLVKKPQEIMASLVLSVDHVLAMGHVFLPRMMVGISQRLLRVASAPGLVKKPQEIMAPLVLSTDHALATVLVIISHMMVDMLQRL
mmetsp:Transcript_44125/g.79161  ORF Transcript_44125/g.79161 Transcript_44125/m.79161 type:complete len:86 (-) Transcript_44125:1955-2212(-)